MSIAQPVDSFRITIVKNINVDFTLYREEGREDQVRMICSCGNMFITGERL